MTEFVGFRAKYTKVSNENNESKKEKGTKQCVVNRKIKKIVYKHFSLKIKHLKQNEIDVKSLKENRKYFIINNSLILE